LSNFSVDSDQRNFLLIGAVVALGLVLTGAGVLSFVGGPDFDIDGRECQKLDDGRFECPVETEYAGSGEVFASDTIYLGEGESFLLPRNGEKQYLKSKQVLTESGSFNSSAWSGSCSLEASFSDGSRSVTVSKLGELSSAVPLGCRAESTTAEDLEIESCSEGLVGLNGGRCGDLARNLSGASLNVVYDLSPEPDQPGFWERVLGFVSVLPFVSVG